MNLVLNRRQLLGGLAAAGLPALAWAQGPSVGLASLVGHQIEVVEYLGQAGSRQPLKREPLNIPSGTIDRPLLLSLADHWKAANGGQEGKLLETWSPKWAKIAHQSSADRDQEAELVDLLAQAGAALGVQRVIALVPARAPAALKLYRSHYGVGMLQGLGFYVDPNLKAENEDTLANTVGVLSPFAYLRLVVIDTASAKVLRSMESQETQSFVPPPPGRGNPWDLLSDEEKFKQLMILAQKGLLKGVQAGIFQA